MKKKLNIKEYFDDENTIDLSLSDLDEVPVKEIATIPKATVVELSNNRITSIGKNFSVSLTHLVKLDLSKNQIKELPDNFGLLVHLKHLDLYHNQIATLPASFSGLRSLRWLDLKDNPLVAALAKAVGECDDNTACQLAAKGALKFTAEIARVEDIKKKEEEQKQKKEAEERLELAQKKDKKKKKKKKNVKATEKVVEKPSNGEILVETKVEQVSTKKPEIRKSSFITMGSFIKFVLITVLLSSLGLFTLRLLDEESYTNVTSSISKNVKYFKSRLPGNTRTYFDSTFKFLYKSFLSISSFVYKTTSNLGQFTVQSYTFLTTDETVQTYLRIFQDYIHIGYIKSVETISFVYKQLSDTVKSYLK